MWIKRLYLVMVLSIALASIALGVIAATVALSPTLEMGNSTEAVVPETIKAGCAGCALLISTANLATPCSIWLLLLAVTIISLFI
jgi:hypothetical protein